VACPLLLASLLVLSAPAAGGSPPLILDQPTPEWREGPVRYLLNLKEDEAYKRKKTPPERQAFISKFWANLDPTPDTPFNERRAEFWKRVNLANALFQDSTKPGWKTDRGKIYILLGPPHERSPASFGELWTYRGLPLHSVPPEVRFIFYLTRSGELTLAPFLARYTPLVRSQGGSYLGDSPISLAMDLASAQIVPGRILLPETSVSSEYFFPILHPRDDFRTYRAADASTLVVMELWFDDVQFESLVPPGSSPQLALSATFTPKEGSGSGSTLTQRLTLTSAAAAGSGGRAHFQASFVLPPGQYHGDFTVLELRSHLGSLFTRTLSVPDYRQKLSLSSVTVTRPGATSGSPHAPYADAATWLSPVDQVFSEGETLHFSYQVYNARQSNEQPNLDLEYRFYLVQAEKMQAVGRPVEIAGVHKEALGYSLPLSGWPVAQYRIQVTVTDRISGETAFREADFQVAAEDQSSPGTSGPRVPR
jgi:GWxTD domain-containing protein